MDTRIEDFGPFVRCLEGYGISVISIDLHHDEGHADPDTDDLRQKPPRSHHSRLAQPRDRKDSQGRQQRLQGVQTVLAESLGMERALTLLSSLQSRYDALAKEYRSLESTTATRIEMLEREKNDLLARLRAMLDIL